MYLYIMTLHVCVLSVCVSTLIGSNSKQEHRRLAKHEMSHIMATLWLNPRPAQMDMALARAIPAQLPHKAARPHQGGKRLGRHTSVTTANRGGKVTQVR